MESIDKITPITQLINAVGIDFDANAGKIYWSDVNKDSISRVNRNGSGRQEIISGQSSYAMYFVIWKLLHTFFILSISRIEALEF